MADHLLPFVLGPLVPPERRVLHEIVENAALLEVDGRRYNGDKDWDEGRKAQTRARSRKPA